MKSPRPEKIAPNLKAAACELPADERALAIHVGVRSGSGNSVVAGRFAKALNARAGEPILCADGADYSGFLSPNELSELSAEVWVSQLTLIF